ncbi:hypothetical protein K474DRAFT_1709534 [Panus rudis PR-1116 ss-1]|nr:hypothetical protein K474DRAFT_1709534 [Panus rudis PR-1116 ss-1]
MHNKFSESLAGPMPTQPFFDTFMDPTPPDDLPRLRRVSKRAFSSISTASTAHDIEDQLMQAVYRHGWCPDFELKRQSDIIDERTGEKVRPRLCLFSKAPIPAGSPDWINLEFFIDVHADENEDPFRRVFAGSAYHFRSNGDRVCGDALLQLETYLCAQYSRQHRTSSFALCVYGRYVRFLLIDRAGVVVTEAINYVNNPRVLAEFFWRYNHLSQTDRGFDSTVIPASIEERRLLTAAVVEHMNAAEENIVRAYPGIESTLAKDYPTYKVQIVDRYTGKQTCCIFRKPCTESAHLLGRATRGFIAYQLDRISPTEDMPPTSLPFASHLVFLKDYWRNHHSKMQIESEAFDILDKLDIPFTPITFSAGDVFTDGFAQISTSQCIANVPRVKWRRPCRAFDTLIHHRIVQQLAFPLSMFNNAKELVQVTRDAVQALTDTYLQAGLLHRDVSCNNILISGPDSPDDAGRGVLNDWDIACKVSASSGGTWRFMSTRLLQDRQKSHDIDDDLESTFWVLLYTAVHHCKHTGQFDSDIFDEVSVTYHNGSRVTCGGFAKLGFLLTSSLVFRCPALNALITDLRKLWCHHYYTERYSHPRSKVHRPVSEFASELLEIFDRALKKGSRSWNHGERVPDQYPDTERTEPRPELLTTFPTMHLSPSAVDCHPDPPGLPDQSAATIASSPARKGSTTLIDAGNVPARQKHKRTLDLVVDETSGPARKKKRLDQNGGTGGRRNARRPEGALRRSQRLRNK